MVPVPLLQLSGWLFGPSASIFGGDPGRWAAPLLLLWAAVGAHDVYRLMTVRLTDHERRLFEITTALRVIAGFLIAVGVAAGITSLIAPAMLAAAAALVAGSTWFEHSARAARAELG